MGNYQHINKALDYIEENLRHELSVEGLARIAGYSEFHFLRLFKKVMRLTPGDYIRKRRLTEIANEIAQGRRGLADIAFENGFNSKENFTRAFRAEHGVLPTEYKTAANSLKLYYRPRLPAAGIDIAPEFVRMEPFDLTVFFNDGMAPTSFWNHYNCKKLSVRLSGGAICADYGVCNWNCQTNRLDYYCGIKTQDAHGDTTDTQQLTIPGGLYAVFTTPPTTHADFVNTIHETWAYLNKWLGSNGYTKRQGFEFETYIEASRTFSEDIYIP
ncbi:MAG: AraC family transcriptional regulator, partial [Clostridia bacterium]|nr:AraC family transcriptional regulator [Clostridia bacterium]